MTKVIPTPTASPTAPDSATSSMDESPEDEGLVGFRVNRIDITSADVFTVTFPGDGKAV